MSERPFNIFLILLLASAVCFFYGPSASLASESALGLKDGPLELKKSYQSKRPLISAAAKSAIARPIKKSPRLNKSYLKGLEPKQNQKNDRKLKVTMNRSPKTLQNLAKDRNLESSLVSAPIILASKVSEIKPKGVEKLINQKGAETSLEIESSLKLESQKAYQEVKLDRSNEEASQDDNQKEEVIKKESALEKEQRSDKAPSQAQVQEESYQKAYEKSLRELFPAKEREVKELRKAIDERQRALSGDPPKLIGSRTQRVRLEPGFEPPLVNLYPGLVTVLIFCDSTGAVWPIASSVLGSSSLYSAEVLEGEFNNQIIVAPLTNQGHSNLVVGLKGSEFPIVIRLETKSSFLNQTKADALIVFQTLEEGPAAKFKAPNKAPLSWEVSETLGLILDGLSPPGSIRLTFEPKIEGHLYFNLGGKLYFRTKRPLLWPAPLSSLAGPGGVWVFETDLVSNLTFLNGEEILSVKLIDLENIEEKSVERSR
ncbi:MAG: hypothetical protein LBV23_10930 [Deltaproteobacteria bacterium]|jgi:hypothetical protein|nr:hypothetical protein [Deltaproteobacteria bacterium]